MRISGVEEAKGGIRIGGLKINNLRYADDTTLAASSEEGLRHLIEIVKGTSESAGLFLNINKTKVMTNTNLKTFRAGNEIIEVVKSFIFLGSTLDEGGECKADVVKRLAMGRVAMAGLSKIWKDRDISIGTKSRLVRALVFTVATYGCETWTTRKEEIKKINAFENWCWRRMLRISWTAKRTNISIWEQVGRQYTLENEITKRKLTYFGHVMRSDDSLEKALILAMSDGKRKRSRPRTRWMDIIKEVTGLNMQQLAVLTRDRNEWRKKVMAVTRGRIRPDGTR